MSSGKPVKYLVFDNDGVNVDSEHVAMRVMDDFGHALVKRYKPDADLKPGDIYGEYPGTSTDKIIQMLGIKYDLPGDHIREDYGIGSDEFIPEALAGRVTIATNEAFASGLKTVDGITDSLAALQARYGAGNMALCTTSREDRMNVSIECAADPRTGKNAGLAAVFPKGERRVSGYGHDNKYVLFFSKSGWNPEETVVIEDSISGVTKAKAANPALRVVGTAAAVFYEYSAAQAARLIEAGASIVVTAGDDLAKAVAWLDSGFDPAQSPCFSSKVYRARHEECFPGTKPAGPKPAP